MEDRSKLRADEISARRFKLRLEDIALIAGLSQTRIAEGLDMTPSRVSKFFSSSCLTNNFPAYAVKKWHLNLKEHSLIKSLCHDCSGVFVQLPEKPPRPSDAIEAAAKAMKEVSDVLHVFSMAVADNKVTWRELENIRREVPEALSALAALVTVAEKMRE